MKFALTIKPELAIRAIPRTGRRAPLIAAPSSGLKQSRAGIAPAETAAQTEAGQEGRQKLYVLYGSNTGASEAFAQRIAAEAPAHGKAALFSLHQLMDSSVALL